MSAIVIENLEKKYSGPKGTHALRGASLSIEKGEIFGLLGPNGAGKTTLIGVLVGLVKKSGGKVVVGGVDLDTDIDSVKAQIGLVPQEVNFNIFQTPLSIVVNQAGYYGIPRSVALPRAHELLDALGLADKKEVPSMKLSGGMKRRLLIARALVHRPRILLLDEPTAGVDVELRRGMWEYIKKLSNEGVTVLLTTHYLEEAENLCARAAIISKGKIVEEGTMEYLLAKSETGKLEDLFIKLTTEAEVVPKQLS